MVPKPVTVSNSGIELPKNRARISSIKSIKTIYIGCGVSTILSIKNQMGPYQRTPKEVAIELLDTQIFSGSVQWVPLVISWILESITSSSFGKLQPFW